MRALAPPGLALSPRSAPSTGRFELSTVATLTGISRSALGPVRVAAPKEFLADVAWHEWAHALSVERCPAQYVEQGARLLELAPPAIAERIRKAGYREREFTHELIAETYSLLMQRRVRGQHGRPPWLHDEIYNLLRTATRWDE